jgi:DNA-binding IclR family transcriptional regulator
VSVVFWVGLAFPVVITVVGAVILAARPGDRPEE